MKKTNFFTIVELMVVVAVLGVLISLLAPSLQRTSSHVNAIGCRNNLSNISKASMVYMSDYDDHVVGPVWGAQRPKILAPQGWVNRHFSFYLEPYMPEFTKTGSDGFTYNEAFICPTNAEMEMQNSELLHHRSHYRNTVSSWINNGPLFGRPRFRNNGITYEAKLPMHLSVIENPSELEMLVDSDLENTSWLAGMGSDYSEYPVHENRFRNNLFFDGTVRPVEWLP